MRLRGKMKRTLNIKIYSKIETMISTRLQKVRRLMLNNDNFTIVCNNCWGGYVYRRFGIAYTSPTIGLYLFADDFIKLCQNLEYYMSQPLCFISYTDSKWRLELEKRQQIAVPLARIDNIEIIFLHYKSEEEARIKWERRVKRINYDNLIFKFSKMNLCSYSALEQFDQLDCAKKICFVPPGDEHLIKSGVYFPSARGENQITDDTSEYARYINLRKLINSKTVCGMNMHND